MVISQALWLLFDTSAYWHRESVDLQVVGYSYALLSFCVRENLAEHAGVIHEAENLEKNGFHAGTMVEDTVHGRATVVV